MPIDLTLRKRLLYLETNLLNFNLLYHLNPERTHRRTAPLSLSLSLIHSQSPRRSINFILGGWARYAKL